MGKGLIISSIVFAGLYAFCATLALSNSFVIATSGCKQLNKRNADHFHHNIYNHMSKKIMERVCKASKETLGQVVDCLVKSQAFDEKAKELGHKCYIETYGVEFTSETCHARDFLQFNQMQKTPKQISI